MMDLLLYFNIVIPSLQHLSPADRELIYKSPLLVCLLIAGADGIIDRKEVKHALHAVKKKSHGLHTEVAELFREVGTDFEDKLQFLLQAYPSRAARRNEAIVRELSLLNEVFPRLDKKFSVELYKCLLLLAEKVAEASGGFLGLGKISKFEKSYLKLPMLKSPGSN